MQTFTLISSSCRRLRFRYVFKYEVMFDMDGSIALYLLHVGLCPFCLQICIILAILNPLKPTMRELTAPNSSQSFARFLTLIREPTRNCHISLS